MIPLLKPIPTLRDFLGKYNDLYPIDRQFATDVINKKSKHAKAGKHGSTPLPQYAADLEDKWYASIQKGEPDYAVYDDYYFFTEMWVCWAICSRGYLRTLLKPHVYDIVKDVKTIADLGCGIGYTTASFTQMFPDSDVTGTNLEGTRQHRFCSIMGESYDFKMASDIQELDQADLVFASEYFEHILAPITHLEEILSRLNPKFLCVANSFNVHSVGHFDYYLVGNDWIPASKLPVIFNRTMARYGYHKIEIKAWNNKPVLWGRVGG